MTTATRFGLFAEYDPDRIAVRGYDSGELTQGELLAAGDRLAARLQNATHLLNLCESRAHFLIGLIAALQTNSIMLLPVSRHVQDLRAAEAAYGSIVELVDHPQAGSSDAIVVADVIGTEALPAHCPSFAVDQPLAVAFTSGSTGTPAMHAKSWGVLSNTARSLASRFGLQTQQTIVGTVPAQHMYGLEMTVFAALQSGAAVFDRAPFYPKDIQKALTAVPEPWLVTTPVHLRALSAGLADLQSEPVSPAGIVSATAPLSVELAARVEQRLGCAVQEIYGCTEAGSIATRYTTTTSRWSLLNGIQFLKGMSVPTLTVPYIQAPVPLQDQIEIGEQDFELLGRNDDTINVAGKRFSLAALNQALLGLPGVEDGVAFLPDQSTHGRPAALVVSDLTTREITRLLAEQVNATFIPRPLVKVERIPRNATGKVVRRELMTVLEASK